MPKSKQKLKEDFLKKFSPKRKHPTEGHRPYITIAGSGPSAIDYKGRVDVATKKITVKAEYMCARFAPWWEKKEPKHPDIKFMCYKPPSMVNDQKFKELKLKQNFYQADYKFWDKYYKWFEPKRITKKPSTGLCTIFCVMERWAPEKIGLIGFDWVLDGDPDWHHDPHAEKACIESLVEIVDLR